MDKFAFKLIFLAGVLINTAQAAVYYVKNGGNDNADGKSDATAWATINKVNKSVRGTGDKVYFKAGGVWNKEQLYVGWSGTADNHVKIGAYYLNNGKEIVGLGSNAKPVFDGKDSVPTAESYMGLVEVSGQYVDVENINLKNSGASGLRFVKTSDGSATNVSIDNVFHNSIHVHKSTRVTVESCEAKRFATDYLKTGRWAGGVSIDRSSYATIRNSVVKEGFGEAIIFWNGSSHVVAENNLVFGARAIGFYVDCTTDVDLRRNVVLGTTDSQFHRGNNAVGAGIALNNEVAFCSDKPLTQNVRVYDNLVAYTSAGMAFWGQHSDSSFKNTYAYNNIFVDNNWQYEDSDGRPKPNSSFKNNILLSLSSGTVDVSGRSRSDGMEWSNNYFSKGDPGGSRSSPTNHYSGVQLAKMNGWRAISSWDAVTWKDFVPQAGSSTIGAGSPRFQLPDPVLAQQLIMDFNGNIHLNPMDMGAFRNGSQSQAQPPITPSGVEVTVK
jgi:hypothetical protein